MLQVRIRPRVSIFCPRCLVWSVLLGFSLIGTAVAQTGDNRNYCKSDGRIALFLVDVTTPYDQTDKDLIVRATDKNPRLARRRREGHYPHDYRLRYPQ